ncbi:MAG: LuxR C-terminal-related transcriptional regulator [Magnetovibrionaceae bacterium]
MRILIADDHAIVRTALRYVVAEIDAEADVAEAGSFQEALAVVENAAPGHFRLLTLDLRMPGLESLTDVRKLVEAVTPAPVVVFSVLEDPDEIRAILAQGVQAYIPKSTDDGLMVNILKLVLAGGTYVPPVLGGVSGHLGNGQVDSPSFGATFDQGRDQAAGRDDALAGLTRRQLEVLELMAKGHSNLDIGSELGLNLSTVKNHVSRIFKVLDVENRTQAVLRFNDERRV